MEQNEITVQANSNKNNEITSTVFFAISGNIPIILSNNTYFVLLADILYCSRAKLE